MLSPTEKSRIQRFSRLLSDFPVLFKADLIFKDFSRKPSKYLYFFKPVRTLILFCNHLAEDKLEDLKVLRRSPDLLNNVCLFVFVALCPMSTAMVIAERSVHLTTLFPGQA